MVLMVSLVAGVFVNGSRGVQQADTGSYARRLATALRTCRQQALTEGQPVAFVLPTSSGSRPHSQSYYQATGHRPRIVRSFNLANEHPRICASVPVLSGTSVIDRGAVATNGNDFNLAAWVISGNLQEDFIFCFTPDGRLLTNDLPMEDGQYHILVSAGLQYSNAAQPSGTGWGVAPSNYYQATSASSPRVLRLSPTGQVHLGSPDPAWGIAEVQSLDFLAPPAPPPNPSTVGALVPELDSVEVFPVPDPALVPPGVEALVDVDGHLTLSVVAKDSDPERNLYCTWASSGPGYASGDGPFSKPDEHQMEWDQNAGGPGLGGWVSKVEWRPPPETGDGDIFELTVQVRDENGGTASGQVGASGRVQAVAESKILFESDRDGFASIYSMLEDGSEVRRIGDPGDRYPILNSTGTFMLYANGNDLLVRPLGGEPIRLVTQAPSPAPGGPHPNPGGILPQCISQDGRRVFWSNGNNAYTALLNGIDPVTPYRLNDDPGFRDPYGDRVVHIEISPLGNKIAWSAGKDIYVGDFDPDPPVGGFYMPDIIPSHEAVPSIFAEGNPRWSPDGLTMYFSGTGNGLDPYRLTFDPTDNSCSAPVRLATSAGDDFDPVTSPDGAEILYFREVAPGNFEIFKANSDGSNVVNLSNHPNNDLRAVWGR